jgi:hypothetical protein
VAKSHNYAINVFLAKWDHNDPETGYEALGNYTDDYFSTGYSMIINMFVPDYNLPPAEEEDPEVVSTKTVNDPPPLVHQATLMDVLMQANGNNYEVAPHITDLSHSGDSNPQLNTIPDWLLGFKFHNVGYFHTSTTTGPDSDENGTYVTYSGSDWMYFIGTPQNPVPDYVGTHGSAYPKLRLDEFPVGAVPKINGARSVTFCYETMSENIYFETTTTSGETVHTLIKPDHLKSPR